jgi:hypothetical protein
MRRCGACGGERVEQNAALIHDHSSGNERRMGEKPVTGAGFSLPFEATRRGRGFARRSGRWNGRGYARRACQEGVVWQGVISVAQAGAQGGLAGARQTLSRRAPSDSNLPRWRRGGLG